MLNVQLQVSFSFGGACSAAHRALAAWCKVEAPLVGSSLGGKLGREIKLCWTAAQVFVHVSQSTVFTGTSLQQQKC